MTCLLRVITRIKLESAWQFGSLAYDVAGELYLANGIQVIALLDIVHATAATDQEAVHL